MKRSEAAFVNVTMMPRMMLRVCRLAILGVLATLSGCVPPLGPSTSHPAFIVAVYDAVTSDRLAGATIRVQGQTGISDVGGLYIFTQVEPGSSLVRVTHPNYVPAEREVRIVRAWSEAAFRLQPK